MSERNLWGRSLQIIRANQSAAGAYVASPNFPTYQYCWFRDGAFTAYAMDLAGEQASAARFHDWAAQAITARAEVVRRAVARAQRGEPLTGADYLHTRYTLTGAEAADGDWPNFQLDGFGTWLWALNEHVRQGGAAPASHWLTAAQLAADYLAALWSLPCYDCWEEFPEHLHPHTLAAIYGGLQAHAVLSGADHRATLAAIQTFIMTRAVADGHFVKFIGSREVDASLLALSVPYGVVSVDHPVMRATVRRIEQDLRRAGGGVHRYAADTYYGGGEWVLLTAWLGWYYTLAGDRARAEAALAWVEAQADAEGGLAEQVAQNLNDAAAYEPWRQRWGAVAQPLLWSQAQYLILCHALRTPASESAR